MKIKNFIAKTVEVLSEQMTKRILAMFAILFCVSVVSIHAQTAIDGALSSVTSDLNRYMGLIRTLCYAVGGICGIVGGVKLYFKMQNGDQDVSQSIVMFFGACILLIAVGTIMPVMFGAG